MEERGSMMSAGVDSVPEYCYWREVVPQAGDMLDVVEPAGDVQILLLLLDGQVHLRKGQHPSVV